MVVVQLCYWRVCGDVCIVCEYQLVLCASVGRQLKISFFTQDWCPVQRHHAATV